MRTLLLSIILGLISTTLAMPNPDQPRPPIISGSPNINAAPYGLSNSSSIFGSTGVKSMMDTTIYVSVTVTPVSTLYLTERSSKAIASQAATDPTFGVAENKGAPVALSSSSVVESGACQATVTVTDRPTITVIVSAGATIADFVK